MAKEIKVVVKTKRVFKRITTVTFFQIYKITDKLEFKPILNENGEPVKFDRRAAAERYCQKHDLCYIEIKHIFYG